MSNNLTSVEISLLYHAILESIALKDSHMTRYISRMPVLGGTWDLFRKNPIVSKVFDAIHLRRTYGRSVPEFVVLPNSFSKMFLDRHEPRGRALLIDGAIGQPILKQIWHQAVEQLKPQIVIDVGTNYGEFLFGEVYHHAVRIVGVEANAHLEPFLQRSSAAHPNHKKMMVKIALASDTSNIRKHFFIDSTSSGRSSVVCRNSKNSQREECETISLDDLFADFSPKEMTTVFKIDVEGFEPAVLRGMKTILKDSKSLFGFIEFNSSLIHQACNDPEQFLDWLSKRFHVAVLHKNNRYEIIPNLTLHELRQRTGMHDVEIDLALMSESTMISILDQSLKCE